MNFEVMKTYILSILVLISLLLTFSLWNYKPNTLSSNNPIFVNEVDLGGKEEIKRSLIEPSTITFHNNERYYGFKTPLEGQKLYRDMQDWILKDYQSSAVLGRPTNNHQVEITFENTLPLEIIRSLFSIGEKDSLPNWSFQRMFILFNQATSSLEVVFLSIDEHQQIKYVVNDSRVYASLWSYMEKSDRLSEYILFGSEESPIYLPKNKLEIKSHSLAVKSINPTLLIDALFSNPSSVSSNFEKSYFADGERGMSVLREGRSMEFINPIHSNERRTDMIELLDLSVENINEHKGWTNDYRLVDVNIKEDLVRYRMFYDGYPIYNNIDLSIIEQQWRNQDLHLYRRPLFSANILFGDNTIKLPSGTEIINYLTNHKDYQLSEIKDIRVGYKLTYFDGASYLTLDPVWYMNYSGNWQEIRVDELDEFMKGGG